MVFFTLMVNSVAFAFQNMRWSKARGGLLNLLNEQHGSLGTGGWDLCTFRPQASEHVEENLWLFLHSSLAPEILVCRNAVCS